MFTRHCTAHAAAAATHRPELQVFFDLLLLDKDSSCCQTAGAPSEPSSSTAAAASTPHWAELVIKEGVFGDRRAVQDVRSRLRCRRGEREGGEGACNAGVVLWSLHMAVSAWQQPAKVLWWHKGVREGGGAVAHLAGPTTRTTLCACVLLLLDTVRVLLFLDTHAAQGWAM